MSSSSSSLPPRGALAPAGATPDDDDDDDAAAAETTRDAVMRVQREALAAETALRLRELRAERGRERALADRARELGAFYLTLVPVRPRRRGERRSLRTFSPGGRSFLSAQGPSVSTPDHRDAFQLRF